MSVSTTCPDQEAMLSVLNGLASPEAGQRLTAHLEHCAPCAVIFEVLREAAPPPTRDQTLSSVGSASSATLPPAGVPQDGNEERITFLAPAQQPDELGRLGSFRILKKLGAGGMGMVFLAEDVLLQRKLALKTMLPHVAASPTARERFLREARAAAALEHPHVVAIYQVGEANGVPFLAMPLLKGESLEDRLQRDQRLPQAEALRIAAEMADGLAAAHEQNLIHRDIKPGNVWLEGAGGLVKLLDFGLARAQGDTAHLTHSGAILGTPAYMAPEQAGGEKLDGRADLFSLGCVLYVMLTGQRPFVGDNTFRVLTSLAMDTPPEPHIVSDAVSSPVSAFTMRLLAKAPADRPATAQATAEELRRLARGQVESKTAVVPANKPATKSVSKPAQPKLKRTEMSPPRRRSHGLLFLGLVGAAVLLVGLLGVGALVAGLGYLMKDRPGNPVAALKGSDDRPAQAPGDRKDNLKDKAAPPVPDDHKDKPKDKAPPDVPKDKPKDKAPPDPVKNPDDKNPAVENALPPTLTIDLGDGVKMEFVLLNAKGNAEFQMGASEGEDGPPFEKPRHKVTLTKPFYLAIYPVTQEQYVKLMKFGNPSYFQVGKGGAAKLGDIKDTSRFPVETVSWNAADAFCKNLMDKHGSQTPAMLRQQKYRFALPTEAQWEYACRAGTSTVYYCGNDAKDLGEYAWYGNNSGGRTHEVGTRKKNAWGLYDMNGNLYQWCEDYYDSSYYVNGDIKDPLNLKRGFRVLRGGSWDFNAGSCRAAYRLCFALVFRDVGFRVSFRLD